MRIIVMSDSHTALGRVLEIVQRNLDADLFIHLGDGEDEYDQVASMFPEKTFLSVRGNNDWRSSKQATGFLSCDAVKIMYTHGDLFSVKWGLDRLIKEGVKNDAQVVLYGHTHVARQDYLDGRYFINPGSVVDSRITPASYLALDITPAGIVPVIRKTEPTPDAY